MVRTCCQYVALTCLLTIFAWVVITELHREWNRVPINGECPYRGTRPATIVLRTYMVSDYTMSIQHRGEEVWRPREPVFFTNRMWKDTVCLDDFLSSCYEFTIHDASNEGLMDGSCEVWWDKSRVGRIQGSFGASTSLRFGRGCTTKVVEETEDKDL